MEFRVGLVAVAGHAPQLFLDAVHVKEQIGTLALPSTLTVVQSDILLTALLEGRNELRDLALEFAVLTQKDACVVALLVGVRPSDVTLTLAIQDGSATRVQVELQLVVVVLQACNGILEVDDLSTRAFELEATLVELFRVSAMLVMIDQRHVDLPSACAR